MRVAALSLVLGLTAFAVPASAQSFVGDWNASAQTPDGLVTETLKVQKTAEGYAITASEATPPPPAGTSAGPAIDIAIDGDSFSFKRIVRTPQGELEILYKGTLSGDSFTGTGEVMGFSVPYNGVRVGAGS